MSAFVDALTKRLGEWWPVALIVVGLPHVIVAWCAWLAGNGHMFDFGYLSRQVAEEITHQTATQPAAAAFALLLLLVSIGAALTVLGLSRGAQRIWFAPWPPGMRWYEQWRIAQRRKAWNALADQHAQASLQADETHREQHVNTARDLGRRRNRISLAPPVRATWMGDRFAAVEARVRERYGLDLEFAWPRLWLVIGEQERAELSAARVRIDRDATLAGWGLLYFALGVRWWLPALLIGVLLALAARRRDHSSVDQLAHLVEAAVDLYVGELATRTRLATELGGLDGTAGAQLTRLFRKNA